jgi:hypothetical protein
MAIATEFIDFIVPIEVIRKKYPGGWEQCLKDHAQLIDGRVWFDEYLFRDGAMNPMDIESLVERWEAMGFVGIVEKDGKKYWQDICVCEGVFGGATLKCDWLEFDRESRAVYLKGTDIGEVVYPNRDYGDDE